MKMLVSLKDKTLRRAYNNNVRNNVYLKMYLNKFIKIQRI